MHACLPFWAFCLFSGFMVMSCLPDPFFVVKFSTFVLLPFMIAELFFLVFMRSQLLGWDNCLFAVLWKWHLPSKWDLWNTKVVAFDSVLCRKCFLKNWWEYMFFVIYQLFHWWSKGMAVLIIWSEPCFGSWSLDGMPVFCIMC